MKRTKFNYKSLTKSNMARISKIEIEVQTRLINIKLDAYEIGKFLCEAKSILPHGSFIKWIKMTFANDLPYSTGQHYMKIYLAFKDRPNQVQYIPTQYLMIFSQNNFPEETLKLIKNRLEVNPEGLQTAEYEELDYLFKLMKEGSIGETTFEKESEKVIALGAELAKNEIGRYRHRINRNMRRTMYFGLGDTLEKLDKAIENARQMAGYFPFDPNDPKHKKVISHIEKLNSKLDKLKSELEGGMKLIKPISTKNGTSYI
ncbi:MAG: DUF3102 domain-containing protein [Balneola sp.]